MKRVLIIFLKILIVLIGIGAIIFMLWEPHIEGRNVNATLYKIYFKDPFLAYAYIASIPFFIALHRTFKFLEYIAQNKIFSRDSIKALRTIKYCAISLVIFAVAPVAYLFIVRPGDDIAGGVFIGLLIIIISSIVAITATILQKKTLVK